MFSLSPVAPPAQDEEDRRFKRRRDDEEEKEEEEEDEIKKVCREGFQLFHHNVCFLPLLS